MANNLYLHFFFIMSLSSYKENYWMESVITELNVAAGTTNIKTLY